MDEITKKIVPADKLDMMQGVLTSPGDEILDKIMELDNPQLFVRQMPWEDFFWLIKKVDEDEFLPLLKMGSDDQKQYLLDLEIWDKDRLNLKKTSIWFDRMLKADPDGLSKWFFSKGESFAYFYFFKNIHVEIKDEDDDHRDFGPDFFTLDGLFYISIPDEELKELIPNILRAMAKENLGTYQTLLITMAGIIPAELEEDMYRQRNIRLAEHGFLPREEALAVYARLDPDSLDMEDKIDSPYASSVADIHELIPFASFFHGQGRNLLTDTFSEIKDDLFLDRLRLEFAGLCNQTLAADGSLDYELATLISACRRASAHLNLIIEKMCNTDIRKSVTLLNNNSLVSLFRAGFGLVLNLKWESERWVQDSWFHGQGLDAGFWGDARGAILAGILKDKPQFYTGLKAEDEYRDFEWLAELNDCRTLIQQLKVLDIMMARLAKSYFQGLDSDGASQLSFHQLVFSLWARKVLDLEPGFSRLSLGQVKAFFSHLRAGEDSPPFRMAGFEDVFIRDFMGFSSGFDQDVTTNLKVALALIWQDFSEEYESVAEEDLECRFVDFLCVD